MIVRLTNHQHRKLIETLGDQKPAISEWLSRDVQTSSLKRVDVAMPAIAWLQLYEIVFDWCYDVRGMRRHGVRGWTMTACKNIRLGLNVREGHPALFNAGAIGQIPELIPAWRLLAKDDRGRHYTPYPEPGLHFTVLAPTTRKVGGEKVTVWVESKQSPHRPLLDEQEHWRFLRG